ncbi:family 43 glycosylhydrolase [Saccharicrinis sp. FJH62]|uniref:family 43 glycosylhydrolase n=1 Tax=Saccharicrinis sp. FJH62 TaxID=3344657 RepID=UPI0035D50EC9
MKRIRIILFLLIFIIPMVRSQKIWHIFGGDHADPTIVRVDKDYYMTFCSYNYVPGLQIYHSENLKDWTMIGYALTKYVGDIWSPELVYFDQKFYIYFPANGTNYVVTADNPEGPWSDPVDLKTNGIDPGHIVTPEGDRYLYFNNGWVAKLAPDGLSIVGKKTKVYDGWPIPNDWIIECFCLESPKLIYKDGLYFMTSAQGGTAGPSTSHMVVSARSENVMGPWENSAYNPVLRTWSPKEEWWSKGHGTIFDDPKGNWYIVYHAYRNNELNRGRQVLIEPVKWTDDGWFRLKRKPTEEPSTVFFENIKLKDDSFNTVVLKPQWQFAGIKDLGEIVVVDGELNISSVKDKVKAMVANTPDVNFDATIKLIADEDNDSLEYGFVLYYDKENYTGIAINGKNMYALDWAEKGKGPVLNKDGCTFFRLIRRMNDLQMAFSKDGESWIYYPTSREVSGYQHNVLRGFKNLKVGVFCKGDGVLKIDDFSYQGYVLKE